MIILIPDNVSKIFSGITIYPFIIIKKKHEHNAVVINHEKIHLRQQKELFIILFFVCYFVNWIFNLIRYRNFDKAYRQIIFEREAYQNQSNLDYLK